MGRIGESVRSKSGLAYSASSGINAWADGGSWEFFRRAQSRELEKAVRLIRMRSSAWYQRAGHR
jgi:hypothetical protein